MAKFIISGPNKLQGEIPVFGAKNAAMKMIAACVGIKGKVALENVPDILDIQTIINILSQNGAEISRNGHALEIDTTNLTDSPPNPKLVEKMRGSIVLVGPYLARFGKISIPEPGGCLIGARPIDIHLDIFEKMGARISRENGCYHFQTNRILGGDVTLKGISVTATENAILAAVTSKAKTVISNAASEPEIVDLANFLNQAGAKIKNAGTKTIEIEPIATLKPISYKVMPDRIEAGTFAALAVVTKSQLKITQCNPDHIKIFLEKLSEIGVNFEKGEDFLYIKDSGDLKATDITTGAYPDLATDLQAPMGLLLTQVNGTSHLQENIFENRLNYLRQLEKMGAKIKIIDQHNAEISGPTKLHGTNIESLDLRSGATLLLAGLAASGETEILSAETIDRGYEKIEERLQRIGAKIQRIK